MAMATMSPPMKSIQEDFMYSMLVSPVVMMPVDNSPVLLQRRSAPRSYSELTVISIMHTFKQTKRNVLYRGSFWSRKYKHIICIFILYKKL